MNVPDRDGLRRTPCQAVADCVGSEPSGYNALMPVSTAYRHFVPRPLPEPERSKRVSAIAKAPTDDLGRLLEQWLEELRGGYTIAGD